LTTRAAYSEFAIEPDHSMVQLAATGTPVGPTTAPPSSGSKSTAASPRYETSAPSRAHARGGLSAHSAVAAARSPSEPPVTARGEPYRTTRAEAAAARSSRRSMGCVARTGAIQAQPGG